MVPIEQLTIKEYSTGASKIERYDKSRDVQVQTNFIGISSSELHNEFMERLNEELPPLRELSSTWAATNRRHRIPWPT
jgi:multidrug efflux pump subunit AcrB